MNKIFEFIKESYEEVVHRVTWPKYSELQQSSTLVLVASLIFAVVIAAVDFIFHEGMTLFYSSIHGAN